MSAYAAAVELIKAADTVRQLSLFGLQTDADIDRVRRADAAFRGLPAPHGVGRRRQVRS